MSEKTEKPTPKRIRDARKEGQIAKSQEVSSLAQLALVIIWLILEAPDLFSGFAQVIDAVLNTTNLSLENSILMLTGVFEAFWIKFVFNMAALLIPALVLIGLLQTGFLFAPKSIMPSAKKINILSNAKQMVSMMKLFELVKMCFKVTVLALIFFYLIDEYASSFAQLTRNGIITGLLICCKMTVWMGSILIIATIIFAVLDYGMQRRQLQKQLMMSLDDIKKEYKNMEGSSEIKQRRRELHREIQSGSLAKKVSKSSLVVRNPTHIAVCLWYQEGETPLPQVLEYGRDARALDIISLAEEMDIPIVENIPLARALVKTTKPGDYIPEELFIAVAYVLSSLKKCNENEGEEEEDGKDKDIEEEKEEDGKDKDIEEVKEDE